MTPDEFIRKFGSVDLNNKEMVKAFLSIHPNGRDRNDILKPVALCHTPYSFDPHVLYGFHEANCCPDFDW